MTFTHVNIQTTYKTPSTDDRTAKRNSCNIGTDDARPGRAYRVTFF